MKKVYVGLGGNIGDSKTILTQALKHMASWVWVSQFRASRLYQTTPVSSIPQDSYVNGVCCFETEMLPESLFTELKLLELHFGKTPKSKEAPRVLDLDLLLFGGESREGPDLVLPHPKWKERLFVLAPLAELECKIVYPDKERGRVEMDLSEHLRLFLNVNHEVVTPIN